MTVTHSQTSVEEDQTAAQDRRDKGEFVRGVSRFRNAVGDVDFPAAPNRYHLFVALNCLLCHRMTLPRNILGLQQSITLDVLFPSRTGEEDPAGPNLWLDLSRNCAAPLTAYYALKENTHGKQTNSRI